MKERRLMRVAITAEFFRELFYGKRKFTINWNLPNDFEIEGYFLSDVSSNIFVVVYSSTFDLIPEGCEIPLWDTDKVHIDMSCEVEE